MKILVIKDVCNLKMDWRNKKNHRIVSLLLFVCLSETYTKLAYFFGCTSKKILKKVAIGLLVTST